MNGPSALVGAWSRGLSGRYSWACQLKATSTVHSVATAGDAGHIGGQLVGRAVWALYSGRLCDHSFRNNLYFSVATLLMENLMGRSCSIGDAALLVLL